MSNTPLQSKDGDFALLAFDLLSYFSEPFLGLGCSKSDVMHALRAFRAAVHGFVLLEKHRAFSDSDDIEKSFDWMIEHLMAGFDE